MNQISHFEKLLDATRQALAALEEAGGDPAKSARAIGTAQGILGFHLRDYEISRDLKQQRRGKQ